MAALIFANHILQSWDHSLPFYEAIASVLGSRSVFHYLGWYAVFRLLYDDTADQQVSGVDIVVGLSIGVLNFLTHYSVTWISATVAGLGLIAATPANPKLRAAAVVLLALSFNGLWGPKFFQFFAFYLLKADAALVSAVLSITQPEATSTDTIISMPGGHSIVIYGPCSSFHNISLGLLCWVTVTKLTRTAWFPFDFTVALLVIAATVLFNASRLYFMALSPDLFDFWHQGLGADFYAWGTTLTVLLISLWGAYRRPAVP